MCRLTWSNSVPGNRASALPLFPAFQGLNGLTRTNGRWGLLMLSGTWTIGSGDLFLQSVSGLSAVVKVPRSETWGEDDGCLE